MITTGTMQDVCSLITDGTHDSPKLQTSGIPFIKGKNISSGSVDFKNCDFITEEDHAACVKRVRPQRDDILFSNIGSVGDTAVVKSDQEFSIKNVALFRPDPEKADPRYVYYLVCGSGFRTGILNQRSGAAQPFITLGNLRTFEFSYESDLPTQRKIAGILSAYDDLIENNLRRIKILEQMAQSLYREWFVHFRFPGHESATFKDSDLGRIPEGWEVVKLKDIIDFINEGETAGPHLNDVPYLPIDCLPRRSLAVLEKRPSCEAQSSLIRFRKHDILFGAMRCYFHKVVIAPFDGTTRKTCFVFRSKERASYSWSLLTLFQDETIAYASNHSKGATIPYAVWEGSLAEMKTIKPPGDLRLRFEELVWPMLERIAGAFDRNENLNQTRDLLLPKLLSATPSGRHSVPATNT
jgi:type I restriction enzyme S subunit